MPVLRLFAAAREAAGEARVEMDGATVADVLAIARRQFGEPFTTVLQRCRVWVNGQPAEDSMPLQPHDVVAVLPPVSGGAGVSDLPAAPPTPSAPSPSVSLAGSSAGGPSAGGPSIPSPTAPSVSDPLVSVPPFSFPPRDPAPLAPPTGPPPGEPGLTPILPSSPLSPSAPPPPPPPPPGPWDADDARTQHWPPVGPPTEASADDLLDRLAGLPAWPGGDPLAEPLRPGSGFEFDQDAAPPPPPPPPPPSPEDVDDMWGPASGPVWSLGEPPPGGPPPPPPPDPLPDWDRRWEGPLEWESGDDPKPEARLSRLVGDRPAVDEPAVRILGPDPFPRPSVPLPPPPPPPRDPPAGPPGPESAYERGGVLIADPPLHPVGVRTPVPENGAAAAAVQMAAPARLGSVDLGSAAPALETESKPVRRSKPPPLAVVSKSTRPHGRLGVLWLAITVAAIVPGVAPAGAWLGVCAGVAGLQTARVWRARNERPLVLLAGATAAALPVSAIWGLRALTGTVAVAVVLTLLARLFSLTKAPARDVGLTLAIGLVIGLAAASVVLLRNVDMRAALLLLTFVSAYDASAYVVGTGAASNWEGPAAGVAMLIPVTMLSAVVLVPPFPDGSPLLLGVIAAILTPCGPLAGSALLGEREANAPALRRLDSLLVMAPIWAWCAAAFLH